MTYEQIIEQVVASGIVPRYVQHYRYTATYRDDITAELYLLICSLPKRRLVDIQRRKGMEGVYAYLSGLLTHQLRSTNSKIYWRYIQHMKREIPTDTWDDESTAESTPR